MDAPSMGHLTANFKMAVSVRAGGISARGAPCRCRSFRRAGHAPKPLAARAASAAPNGTRSQKTGEPATRHRAPRIKVRHACKPPPIASPETRWSRWRTRAAVSHRARPEAGKARLRSPTMTMSRSRRVLTASDRRRRAGSPHSYVSALSARHTQKRLCAELVTYRAFSGFFDRLPVFPGHLPILAGVSG